MLPWLSYLTNSYLFLNIYYIGTDMNQGGSFMNIKNRLIEDFYYSTKESMEKFIEYLPAILPVNEDDAKTLSIALDMVKQLKSTLDNAETIKDLEDIIDLDLLKDDWYFDQNRMMVTYSADVYNEIYNIGKRYTVKNDEEDD